MATADSGGPDPDLYRLLGVPPDASRADIGQAYRRKARAVHPDSRPLDTAASARFRALADAYQVLSHPARRADYDRALAHRQAAGPGLAARLAGDPSAGMSPLWPVQAPGSARLTAPPVNRGAPLWAGPVRIEPPGSVPASAGWHDQRAARLAALAELLDRYLHDSWSRSW